MANRLVEKLADLIRVELADFFEINQTDNRGVTGESDQLLAQLRAALGERLAVAHTHSKRLANVSNELAEYAAKAEFAVSHGRDDLARSALERKLGLTKEADSLREELSKLDEQAARLENAITKLQAQHGQETPVAGDANGRDEALAELDALFASQSDHKT